MTFPPSSQQDGADLQIGDFTVDRNAYTLRDMEPVRCEKGQVEKAIGKLHTCSTEVKK